MKYNRPKEVLDALIQAYYYEKDIEKILSCVTDDIEWIGTEKNECAKGKTELRKLLGADMKAFPRPAYVELDEPSIHMAGPQAAVIDVIGRLVADEADVVGLSVRGTICCVDTDQGWLVFNGHTSIPSTERERLSLRHALDDEREKQKALLDNVPGGVAMYRVKKDGRIPTDYVSDGLAKICGYDDSEDIMQVMGYDSRRLVWPEDYPVVAAACKASLETGVPTSVHYRIRGKAGNPIYVSLDSVVMQNATLVEDDVAVFYAVQTLISKEATQKAEEQRELLSLLNTVPAGIGIFDVNEEGIFQNYMNDAFYNLIGAKREDRLQYFGNNVLATVHPNDVNLIKQNIHLLLRSNDSVQLDYRIKGGHENWVWLHLVANVVKRDSHSIRLHVAYYECTQSKLQQIQLLQNQKAVALAEKQGRLSIWTYNIDRGIITQQVVGDKNGYMGYPSHMVDVPNYFVEMGSIYHEDIEKFLAAYERLNQGETQVDEIYRLKNLNSGKFDWVHMYYQRMDDNDDGERIAVGFYLEVNTQQEAVERYQVEQKLREQMYASAAIYMEYNLTNCEYVGKNNLAADYRAGRWECPTIDEYRENMSLNVDAPFLDEIVEKNVCRQSVKRI